MNQPQDLPLRDIHLPADPSWWPPAPGWWILLGLLTVLILLFRWWYTRQQQRRLSAISLAKVSLYELRDKYSVEEDAETLVRELSALLRRLSISTFPRTDTAGLTGEAWLQFLDKTMNGDQFCRGPGRILVDAPYRPAVKTEEVTPLFELCESWINAVTESKHGAAT